MRILVTGANGFIGSAFVRLACASGHAVAGFDLSAPRHEMAGTKSLTWIRGDLEDPPWEQIEAFQPDALVHFAWIATPGVYLESPRNDDYVRWSLQFVQRCVQEGVEHVLGVGTCIEYRITGEPLAENATPLEPLSPYARSKDTLRARLEEAATRDGFGFCWGRVFYPYGLGEHPDRLCSSMIARLSNDEEIVLKTPGSTKDYIHIDDLAAAILTTLENRMRGTINWGTGRGIAVRELAGTLAEAMGKPTLVKEDPDASPDPLDHVVADASKLRSLGWSPQVSLREGVRQLCENLKSEPD